MKTAEWQCTACNATNRRLVPDDATTATDRCVTCHTRHIIEIENRPVRWSARQTSPRAPLPTGRGGQEPA
jgi:hypothetical protein